MFKKKTEIHAVPTETVTGLALKQSLEPITQITKSLKENRKSLIEEEMQTASQISDIQGSFDTILAQSDQVASGMAVSTWSARPMPTKPFILSLRLRLYLWGM
jgi:methyl-accepting chemotaxis protein